MFDQIIGEKKENAICSLRISEIIQALLCHGDIWTWYNYYNNAKQADDVIHTLDIKASDMDYECENQVKYVEASQQLALDWNVRCKAPTVSLGTEENKPLGVGVGELTASGGEKKEPDPWVSSAILLTPLAYAHQQIPKQAPDTTLEPMWVYGYQSEKSRNNVRYTSRGDIVYHVSRYSIVYNIENHEQTIFTGHYNEIQCLAMHPVSLVPYVCLVCIYVSISM